MSGTRDWDASTYDRVSAPQLEWARGVVGRLELRGDESVLDAGCGSGRVTELLLDAVPRGRVVAVDGSEAMVAAARERLGGRAEVQRADLLELSLQEPVDAIFSSAVFHWIPDHGRLFDRLARALRPGGRLEAQCGGHGNTAALYAAVDEVATREPFSPLLESFSPFRFATAEETEERLLGAGLTEVRCWLQPWPVVPPEPREFIRSVCLGAHLELLPPEERTDFLDAVMDRLGDRPEIDYVRLNISARRVGGPGWA